MGSSSRISARSAVDRVRPRASLGQKESTGNSLDIEANLVGVVEFGCRFFACSDSKKCSALDLEFRRLEL